MKFSDFGIGSRIAERRAALGLTQKQLAEVVRVSASHLGRIERDEPQVDPKFAEIVRIAVALEISFVRLVHGDRPGLIDISNHWPGNQDIIEEVIRRLRTREEYVESNWPTYCREVLGLDHVPPPPWSIKNF